ncbi:lipopolysaccharide biosynthesis protein, partial [Bacteroides thetaiotaomicron]
MAVSLYTSRVVLDVLGVSDFGIYNVIGGVVVLISIINNSMSAATQRFITFELGKGDLQRVSNTFSMSMSIHFLICILVFLLGETLGVYYVDNYLNVPADRMNAAFWLFQISLVTLFFNIIRIPYHASIIAYEKMDFFAIISIIEVFLQLAIVFLLTILDIDKLILYGLLILVVTAVS